MQILKEIGLSFDDVLLVPRKSSIKSRFSGEIDLSAEIVPGIKLRNPLVAANMDTICEVEMANKMFELGGLGIVHRFLSVQEQLKMLREVKGIRTLCIGAGEKELERFKTINLCIDLDVILIDMAHGHSDLMIEQVSKIREISNIPIIAGSISTYSSAVDLMKAGVSCLKVGQGPGSRCKTRIQTGCGVPQLTALIDVKRAVKESKFSNGAKIMCDGGVKNAGDCIKALAAGADTIMSGFLFAGTKETPKELILQNNGLFKVYRGSASYSAQKDWKGKTTSVEGEASYIPYKGELKGVFDSIISNMLSGMSYQDARNIKELQSNATFIQMTSAGYKESAPRL